MKDHKPESEHRPPVAAGSPRRRWRAGLLVLLGVAAVILFVTIQNRIRTRQSLEAWQNVRAELEAKGESPAGKFSVPHAFRNREILQKNSDVQNLEIVGSIDRPSKMATDSNRQADDPPVKPEPQTFYDPEH